MDRSIHITVHQIPSDDVQAPNQSRFYMLVNGRDDHSPDDGEAASDKTIHKAFGYSITLLLVFLAVKFKGPESLFKKYRVFISVFFVTSLAYVRTYVAMGLRQLSPAVRKCSIVKCVLIVAGFACCGLLLFILVPVVDFIVISILTVLSLVPLGWYQKMFAMVIKGTRCTRGCVGQWFGNRCSSTSAEGTNLASDDNVQMTSG